MGFRFAGGAEISGDGEVAVHRERERPRDRRGRHVQDVRAPSLRERGALLDAEAVLLVDDGDGEVGELDVALDEGMRADRDADVPRGDELVRGPPLAGGEARREERDPDAELARRSASIVRKCCSASVSVGAISAP